MHRYECHIMLKCIKSFDSISLSANTNGHYMQFVKQLGDLIPASWETLFLNCIPSIAHSEKCVGFLINLWNVSVEFNHFSRFLPSKKSFTFFITHCVFEKMSARCELKSVQKAKVIFLCISGWCLLYIIQYDNNKSQHGKIQIFPLIISLWCVMHCKIKNFSIVPT